MKVPKSIQKNKWKITGILLLVAFVIYFLGIDWLMTAILVGVLYYFTRDKETMEDIKEIVKK